MLANRQFERQLRNPQLDLLRGIAVLMVIAFHCQYPAFMAKIGWAGVDLFFVLSGFLISGLLFDDWQRLGRFRIWRFYARRGFKIYPPFFAFLLLTFAITIRRYDGLLHWHELFFLQDYLPHVWSHTWSLAVEEHFYLVLPLVLLALAATGRETDRFRSLPILAALLILGCTALRVVAAGSTPGQIGNPHIVAVMSQAHLRADALFLGVALGYLFRFRPELFTLCSRFWLPAPAMAFLAPLALYGRNPQQIAWVATCNELGFGLLLCWAVTRRYLRLPFLERIGFYSYSIYIWHVLVLIMLPKSSTLALFVCAMVACVAVGIGAAKVVEIPALRLRDRITNRKARREQEERHPPAQVRGAIALAPFRAVPAQDA